MVVLFACFLAAQSGWAARTPLSSIAKDPYISALVLDADTGKVLFSDHADAVVYPASVLKLMDLLVILNRVNEGSLRLDEMVQVTVDASRTGGSQVYLDPREQFSVDELLYALMVQSANDAAVALATHVAGSKEGFVALMNETAAKLGMKDTHFYSVNGLPPSDGQKPDVTTASDMALLCRELAKRPDALQYTGTKVKGFRQGAFIMRNHNHLLGRIEGSDGFKTGYFTAAGFSIAVTAKRGGKRVIAIVMGSRDRLVRDAKAADLLEKGFVLMSSKPETAAEASLPETAVKNGGAAVSPEAVGEVGTVEKNKDVAVKPGGRWSIFFLGLGVGMGLAGILAVYIWKRGLKGTSRKFRNF